MRLATRPNGTRDGSLWVVSTDGLRATCADGITPSLRQALEEWDRVEPELVALAAHFEQDPDAGEPFDEPTALAPLPRTWQWLDASAFLNHGSLLSRSMNLEPIISPVPLMYQGMSHEFLAPRAPSPRWLPDGDLDFEGEFAVILRDVPAGVDAAEAPDYIALMTFVNDWSLRSVVRTELLRKFGLIQSKPATAMAPFAVTPDELGDGWRDGRVVLPLTIELNGERFGSVPGDQMDYSFGELIAFAARTRNLAAGTVLGSGTVSSTDYARTGSACIAERRGIELIESGEASTPYLVEGDRVAMQVSDRGRSLFGQIDQIVVSPPVR